MALDLVAFQKEIFDRISEYKNRGDERLCIRAISGGVNWAIDGSDITHVAQMKKNHVPIPGTPSFIKGLIQQDGEIYTIFDLGEILTGQNTTYSKSNRILMLHQNIMQGVALLVESTPGLLPLEQFDQVDLEDDNLPFYAEVALALSDESEYWYWLDLQKLLKSNAFQPRRLDVNAKTKETL